MCKEGGNSSVEIDFDSKGDAMIGKEKALTLKEAAEILDVSYFTLFRRRHQIAFQVPGTNRWRIWPSELAAATRAGNNLKRLSLRVDQEKSWRSAKIKSQGYGGLISPHPVAKELDALLAQKTKKKRKSTTIN